MTTEDDAEDDEGALRPTAGVGDLKVAMVAPVSGAGAVTAAAFGVGGSDASAGLADCDADAPSQPDRNEELAMLLSLLATEDAPCGPNDFGLPLIPPWGRDFLTDDADAAEGLTCRGLIDLERRLRPSLVL